MALLDFFPSSFSDFGWKTHELPRKLFDFFFGRRELSQTERAVWSRELPWTEIYRAKFYLEQTTEPTAIYRELPKEAISSRIQSPWLTLSCFFQGSQIPLPQNPSTSQGWSLADFLNRTPRINANNWHIGLHKTKMILYATPQNRAKKSYKKEALRRGKESLSAIYLTED